MPRPKNTQSIIDAIKRQLNKKYLGYTQLEILAKGIVYNALPRTEDGKIATDGKGEMDLKAAQFITHMVDGKPKETKNITVDVFGHYPEEEKKINLDKYDIIEVEPEKIEEAH